MQIHMQMHMQIHVQKSNLKYAKPYANSFRIPQVNTEFAEAMGCSFKSSVTLEGLRAGARRRCKVRLPVVAAVRESDGGMYRQWP